jgi:hypothetical protein
METFFFLVVQALVLARQALFHLSHSTNLIKTLDGSKKNSV